MEDWVYLKMRRNVRTRVDIKTMIVQQSGPGSKFYLKPSEWRVVPLTQDMIAPLAAAMTTQLFK